MRDGNRRDAVRTRRRKVLLDFSRESRLSWTLSFLSGVHDNIVMNIESIMDSKRNLEFNMFLSRSPSFLFFLKNTIK